MVLPQRTLLGDTGIEVSTMGLGGHTFLGDYSGVARADRDELLTIISTAVDERITLFDVTYDEERETFGSLVDELGVREHLVVSVWMEKAKTETGAGTIAEAERALAQLGMDRVDILYLDWTCTPEQVDAMLSLKQRGLIRAIGVLGQGAAESSDLSQVDVLLLNHNYYWRDREPGLAGLAADNPGMGMITLEPIGRGRFAMEAAQGAPIASACLKYALAFESADTTLIAVRRLAQLAANIETWKADLTLTEAEIAALESGRGYA